MPLLIRKDGSARLQRGDTAEKVIAVKNAVLPEGSVLVLAIADPATGAELLYKTFAFEGDSAVMRIANADTREIPLGKYVWNVRVVTGAAYDENVRVVANDEADNVISLFCGARPFELVEEVAHV